METMVIESSPLPPIEGVPQQVETPAIATPLPVEEPAVNEKIKTLEDQFKTVNDKLDLIISML